VTDSDPSRFRQRVRYRFDRVLARGTWATLLGLGVVTFGVVAISGVILALFNVTFTSNEDVSFFEDAWQSLLRIMDPGTMAGDVGWGRRFLALGITLFGLLVAGTLIGIIAAGVEERIDRMRSGRSMVFESGHVVVLGASDRLPTLIRQLVLANVGRRGKAIVIMADRDAVEMQDQVRRVVTDDRTSRLVFRSGDQTHPANLEIVRLHEAETVIVLSAGDAGDSTAIRTVIAVDSALGGLGKVRVVVELSEPASARELVRVYPAGLHPIILSEGIGRIASLALREPGVGQVALALVDDRGSDIHVTGEPALESRPFSEMRDAFPDARPIGYLAPDGAVLLNPPPNAPLAPGHRLVLVSEPEHTAPKLIVDSANDTAPAAPARELSFEQPERHLLVLGWSALGARLLTDWVPVASETSTVEILLDPAVFAGVDVVEGIAHVHPVDISMAADPEDVARRLERSPRVDTIVLLASASQSGEDQADSRTLLTLVALRRMLASMTGQAPRIMIEILNVDNVPLVEVATHDDFVVSDAIGSQLIAQLAELPERRSVLLELYAPDGPSLHVIPARGLGLTGPTRAADVYRTASSAGVLAIGYRNARDGLVLNPLPSRTIDLDDGDHIVVIG
jgi:Castor and Pollux, part of voltage-gated ion channel/Calcium-activated potassium channel slowpoke-like RCK domain